MTSNKNRIPPTRHFRACELRCAGGRPREDYRRAGVSVASSLALHAPRYSYSTRPMCADPSPIRPLHRHMSEEDSDGGCCSGGSVAVVSHPRFFISILSFDAAKDRPITDTDVQSDGRRLRVSGDSRGALPIRDAVAAADPC
eukprot:scaffold23365_cov115-Isochrysis_galbana.AAC.11